MASLPQNRLTPEEYLARERKAEFKSEYLNGETFAMAGTSIEHTRLVRNLAKELGRKLDAQCEFFIGDLRLEVSFTGLFTYPDVSVVCGEPKLRDDGGMDTLLNPTLLVEVLSPSTANYDKGGKFDHYKGIASLREYVLIAQDKVHVETRVRQPGDQWLITDHFGTDGRTVMLGSIGVSLDLDELYDKVFTR